MLSKLVTNPSTFQKTNEEINMLQVLIAVIQNEDHVEQHIKEKIDDANHEAETAATVAVRCYRRKKLDHLSRECPKQKARHRRKRPFKP